MNTGESGSQSVCWALTSANHSPRAWTSGKRGECPQSVDRPGGII